MEAGPGLIIMAAVAAAALALSVATRQVPSPALGALARRLVLPAHLLPTLQVAVELLKVEEQLELAGAAV